jgi:hypothetical protein
MPINNPHDPAFEAIDREQDMLELGLNPDALRSARGPRQGATMDQLYQARAETSTTERQVNQLGRYDAMVEALNGQGLPVMADRLSVESAETRRDLNDAGYHTIQGIREGYRQARGEAAINAVRAANDGEGFWKRLATNVLGSDAAQIVLGGVEPLMRPQQVLYGLIAGEGGQAWSRMFPHVYIPDENGEIQETSPWAATIDAVWAKITGDEEGYEQGMDAVRQANMQNMEQGLLEFSDVVDARVGEGRMDEIYSDLYGKGVAGQIGMGLLATVYAGAEIFLDPLMIFEKLPGAAYTGMRGWASSSYKATSSLKRSLKTNRLNDIYNSIEATQKHLDNAVKMYNAKPGPKRLDNLRAAYNMHSQALDHIRIRARGAADTALVPQQPRRGLAQSLLASFGLDRLGRAPDPDALRKTGWELGIEVRKAKGQPYTDSLAQIHRNVADEWGGPKNWEAFSPVDHRQPHVQAMTEIADALGFQLITGEARNITGLVGISSSKDRTIAIDLKMCNRLARRVAKSGNITDEALLLANEEAAIWSTFIHELQHGVFNSHMDDLAQAGLADLIHTEAKMGSYHTALQIETKGAYPANLKTTQGMLYIIDEAAARTAPDFLLDEKAWAKIMEFAPETGARLIEDLAVLSDRMHHHVNHMTGLKMWMSDSAYAETKRRMWKAMRRAAGKDKKFMENLVKGYKEQLGLHLDGMKANRSLLKGQEINTPMLDSSIKKVEDWIEAIEKGKLDRLEEYGTIQYEAARVMSTDELARAVARDRVRQAVTTTGSRQSNMTRNWYKDKDGNWVQGEFIQTDLGMPMNQPMVTEQSLPAGMKFFKSVEDDGSISRVLQVTDADGNVHVEFPMELGDGDVGIVMMSVDEALQALDRGDGLLQELMDDLAEDAMGEMLAEAPEVAMMPTIHAHADYGAGKPARLLIGGAESKTMDAVAQLKALRKRIGGEQIIPLRLNGGDSIVNKNIDLPSALFNAETGEPIRLRGFMSKKEPDALRKQLFLERFDRIANGPDQVEVAATGLAQLVDGADPDDIMVLLGATPERQALTGGRIVPGTVAGMIDMDRIAKHVARIEDEAKAAQKELWHYSPETARLKDAMLATKYNERIPYDDGWLASMPDKSFNDVNSDWWAEHQETFYNRIGRGLDPDSWHIKAPQWMKGAFQWMREPMRALESMDSGNSWPILRTALYDAENETTRLKAVFNDAMVRFGAVEEEFLNPLQALLLTGGKNGRMKTNKEMSEILFDMLDTPEGSETFIGIAELYNLTDEQLKAVADIRKELNIIANKLGIEGTSRMIGDNGYIHHAFDPNWYAKGGTLPENAGLSANGHVFLAALLRRNGAAGYSRDAVAVLDLYSRGVARKLHIEPGLLRFKERIKMVAMADPSKAQILDYGDLVIKQIKGEPSMLGSLIDKMASRIAGAQGKVYQPGTVSRKVMAVSGLMYSSLLAGNRRYPIMNIATSLATTGAQFGLFRTVKGMFKAATPEGQLLFEAVGGNKLWSKIFEAGPSGDKGLVDRLLELAPKARILAPSIEDTENFIRGMTFWASIDETLTKGGFRNVAEAHEAGVLGEILFDSLRTTEEVNHYFGVASKPPWMSRISKSGSVAATQFLSFPFKQGEQLLAMAGQNPGKIGNYMMLSGWISRVGAQELGLDLREYVGFNFAPGSARDLTSPGVAFMLSAVKMMGSMSALHDGYGDVETARMDVEDFVKKGETLIPLLGRVKELVRYEEVRTTGQLAIPGLGYSREVDVEFGGIGGFMPIPTGEKGQRSEAMGILTGARSVGGSLDVAARKKTQQVINSAAIERLALADKAWEAMQSGDNAEMVRQLKRMAKMGFPVGDISSTVKARAEAARLHWYILDLRRNRRLAHKLVPIMDEYGILKRTGDE